MDISELLVLFGGTQFVIQGLFAFLGKIWINRVHEKEKAIISKEMEEIKYQLDYNKSIAKSVMDARISNKDFLYQKKSDAATVLWKDVISIKSKLPPAVLMYDILSDDEFPFELSNNEKMREVFEEVKIESFLDSISRQESDLEVIRPFLSNQLWILYFVYKAFVIRIVYLLERGVNIQNVVPAHRDEGVLKILENVFDHKIMKEFRQMNLSRFEFAQQILTSMILSEINKLLNNREELDNNVADYLNTIKLVEELRKI